jgi:predicted AlkP superfamily phosphohydrolase/phosphomutase
MGARLARVMTCRLTMSGVDWATSPAFALPSDEYGSIRLNLRGRERDGILDPSESDELMDAIAAGLMTFRDLGGGPAVEAVERSADLVPGRSVHLFPDLVVRWADTPGRIRGVRSERYGEVLRRGSGKGRSGGHNAEAFALVVPGRLRARTPARRPDVADIATTICTAVGLDDVPAGESLLDGI